MDSVGLGAMLAPVLAGWSVWSSSSWSSWSSAAVVEMTMTPEVVVGATVAVVGAVVVVMGPSQCLFGRCQWVAGTEREVMGRREKKEEKDKGERRNKGGREVGGDVDIPVVAVGLTAVGLSGLWALSGDEGESGNQGEGD